MSTTLEHVGGSWNWEVDNRRHTWDVSATDPNSNAGIGASDVWTMRLTVRSDPTAEVDGNTSTTSEDITIYGSTAGGSEPVWDSVTATPPADSSANATITLDADSAPPSYTAKVYERYDDYTGWTSWVDVTSSLSPTLTAPPTTSTNYTRTTAHTRVAGGLSLVRYEWRCEILDASSNVVSSQTTATSWYVGSP